MNFYEDLQEVLTVCEVPAAHTFIIYVCVLYFLCLFLCADSFSFFFFSIRRNMYEQLFMKFQFEVWTNATFMRKQVRAVDVRISRVEDHQK